MVLATTLRRARRAAASVHLPGTRCLIERRSVRPSGDPRIEGCMDDLEDLLPAMDAIHPALYDSTSKTWSTGRSNDWWRSFRTRTTTSSWLACSACSRASARTAGTARGRLRRGTGDYLVHSLPLRPWSFADGLFVVDALGRYRALIGDRVVSIAGRPIRAALDAVHLCATTRRRSSSSRRAFLVPENLHGVGLVGRRAGRGGIEAASGASRTIRAPVEMGVQ